MRITYLHQYFATPESATGTRSYELARRLVERGHDVTVIASTAQLPGSLGRATRTTHADVDGIDVLALPVPYRNEMSYRKRMQAFARFAAEASYHTARQSSDVVFATSTPLTIAVPALVARLGRRTPMVFEVRDLWPELPIAMGALRNPLLRGAARALEWSAYHGAVQVVALSDGMADGVVARGIPRDRVTVVPNACDVERFDVPEEAGAAVRASVPGLAPGAPLVVYAGALGRINGVRYLVDVAARLRTLVPEARVLIHGAGHDEWEIRSHARALGVLDETLFLRPPVPKDEVPALLAAATVATSLFIPLEQMWINSANKFFDALAAGRPIAIDYGGWHRNLLEESGAGIAMAPGDAAKGAEKLAAFVTDPDRLARARAASRSLARERFDRDVLGARFADVLERAAFTRV